MTPRLLCSRRRFCRMAGLIPFAAVFGSDAAASPEADYETGTRLLQSGRNYLQAIAALERAVRAQPENAAYQSALGCAYAARFASICCALRGLPLARFYEEEYQKRKQEWDAAQADPSDADYHAPPPDVPAPLATPDDHVPIALTQKDIRSEGAKEPNFVTDADKSVTDALLVLGQKSLAAFDAAHRLAARLPADQQASIEYERGWGLLLLWHDGLEQEIVSETVATTTAPKTAPQTLVVSPERASEAFGLCTGANAGESAYWFALGVSLVPHSVLQLDWGRGLYSPYPYPDSVQNAAAAAFDRALVLQPHNKEWLVLSSFALWRRSQNEGELVRSEQAARVSGNAVLWKFAALRCFLEAGSKYPDHMDERAALFERGFAALEKGGRAAKYQNLAFTFPVPRLLRAAWAIHPLEVCEGEVLGQILVDAIIGYCDEQNAVDGEKSEEATPHAAHALLSMGLGMMRSVLRLLAATVNKDDFLEDNEALHDRLRLGFSACEVAQNLARAVQKKHPSTRTARLVRQFSDATAQAEQEYQRLAPNAPHLGWN